MSALEYSVVELTAVEIACVGGGQEKVPAGTCPKGTYKSNETRDANGNLKSYTCTPNQVEKGAREADSLWDTAKEAVSSTWDRLTGGDDKKKD